MPSGPWPPQAQRAWRDTGARRSNLTPSCISRPHWVGRLTGGALPAFAPASVARVDLEIAAWEDLGAGTGTLRWLVGPGEAATFVEPREG